jgi:hypothetical protein
MQSAGGHQMEYRLLTVDDQRVPGIVAALESDDVIGLDRQKIDDLALAFVAPLQAYNDYALDSFGQGSAQADHVCFGDIRQRPEAVELRVIECRVDVNERHRLTPYAA